MDETVAASGDSGTVKKLDAAKAALQRPIRDQPPGSRLGIRTYPGGTVVGSCESGKWLVDLGEDKAPLEVLGEIDSLTAVGDTPTGPALEAVIADLKDRGITSANIVVVSDGLYTCGTDPCEVAKSLAGTGFSVTIQAVGFAISEEGAENLKCMAEATGGNYFDAANSDELVEVIDSFASPEFELTIVANPEPAAGTNTTIAITVRNKGIYDAQGVQLSLTFNTGSNLITPRVLPATIGLGTLPAGNAATRKWTVVAGPPEYASTANYVVSASSAMLRPTTVQGSFTTTTAVSEASDAGPILRDLIENGRSLVILGDSFSSGQGVHSYLPKTDDVSEDCHRSPDTYLAPTFTAANVRVEILACSGAVTANFQGTQTGGGKFLATPQLNQLVALQSTPGAAVMTMGGNDIGFADIVGKCVTPKSFCGDDAYTSEVLRTPGAIKSDLVVAYKDAWSALNTRDFVAARGGDYAPLIVLAYPQAVHEGTVAKSCPIGVVGPTGGFDATEAKFATDLVKSLNIAVKEAVHEAAEFGMEVYFVPNTEAAFAGHTICADENRWVNRVEFDSFPAQKPESVHPNAKGYSAMTYEIIKWSSGLEWTNSFKPSATVIRYADGVKDRLRPDSRPAKTVTFSQLSNTSFNPGQIAQVIVANMGAAPVTVEIHSTPRLLTTLSPNEGGVVKGTITIPTDTPVGAHELVLTGWDSDGGKIVKTAMIVVKPMTPTWVSAIGIAGGLMLIGAIVLAARLRRQARSRSVPE
jgi:lysophospholipase L1-like esterase